MDQSNLMAVHENSVLLIAEPGLLRDCLRALLNALSQAARVEEADTVASALEFAVKHQPSAVLFAMNMPAEEAAIALRQIKSRSPRTQRIILVDTAQQKQQIEAPSAEAVLLKGGLPADLVATFRKLLAEAG